MSAVNALPDIVEGEHLPSLDNARELIALGLRPAEGFDLARIEQVSGEPINAAVLETLTETGLIIRKISHVALTPEGRLLADRIAGELSP